MPDVVIAGAVRTPFGKRNGSLSTTHSVHLLGNVMTALLERAGVAGDQVDQVVGGCVGQIGMQGMNVTRNAWLTAGLSLEVPAITVDAQCGSSQEALTIASSLVQSRRADVVVACGVELMSRVPMGATVPRDGSVGKPITRQYWAHHEFTTQFEGAERMARKWGLSREDCDRFALLSQDRARAAVATGRFGGQLVPVEVAVLDEKGLPSGGAVRFDRDECPRASTLEGLAGLTPTAEGGLHTAGSSSQISDGASAVLVMSRERAEELGVEVLATVVDDCLVGSDPVLMLTGPIAATTRLLDRNSLAMTDIDVVEINEAFASVVLAWAAELGADMGRVNVNGGAIALGHPLGATGTGLVAKAVHELVLADGEYGLVTMCCGGGLGTGTLLRRG
jgi:acetyl-CoA C-acetyltransferase